MYKVGISDLDIAGGRLFLCHEDQTLSIEADIDLYGRETGERTDIALQET